MTPLRGSPRMRALLAFALVLPALAGCLQPEVAVEPAASADAPVVGTEGLSWQGGGLKAEGPRMPPKELFVCSVLDPCPEPEAKCGASNCERRTLDVVVPEGFQGALAVALRWPTDHSLWYLTRVYDADGELVARGYYTEVDHLSSLALVDDPATGAYTVEVILASGAGTYEAVARLLPDLAPPDVLLPDIVTLVPTDLRIEMPPYHTASSIGILPTGPLHPIAEATGAKGCGFDEIAGGAKRCLRFSNAVGNVGAGPLDILLPPGSSTFVQRVWRADGTHEDHDAGTAEFHAIHAHFHNGGASLFTVYAYDNATGKRGEPVAESRKTGICFADIGLVDLHADRMALPGHRGMECVNPVANKGWAMGLSVGWFDLYDWLVADQYVEITGVPDGTYELCSVANPDATLREADASNNGACAVFVLEGDKVTTLSPDPYHKSPE